MFQLLFPTKLISEILFLNHDNALGGHLGTKKTYCRIEETLLLKKRVHNSI